MKDKESMVFEVVEAVMSDIWKLETSPDAVWIENRIDVATRQIFQKHIPELSFDGQEFLEFKMTVMKKLSGFVTDWKRVVDGTLEQRRL